MNKICGLVWGAALGDALGKFYEGKGIRSYEQHICEFNEVDFPNECNNDWTDDADQLVLVMDNLVENNMRINVKPLARSFKRWKFEGFPELGDNYGNGIGLQTNFVVTQEGYLEDPLRSSRRSYLKMGDKAGNGALMRNAICGITSEWHQNTILQCLITHFDSRCVASCLVQSYIINCLFTNENISWDYIYNICENYIEKHRIRRDQNLAEFNNFWNIGLDYGNLLSDHDQKENNDQGSCFLSFLKRLKIGNYEENGGQGYTLLAMALCIAIIFDMDFEKHRIRKNLDTSYYKRRIQEICSMGGDADTNSCIVGTIIGIEIGYKNIPKDWIQRTENRSWLNNKLRGFMREFVQLPND
jgi:ADP-ribosylglycohydrolase